MTFCDTLPLLPGKIDKIDNSSNQQISSHILAYIAMFREFYGWSISIIPAGKLSVVASGPEDVFHGVRSHLETFGGLGATYVGEGELSRIVKICHNVH